jgi:hypothetical protein
MPDATPMANALLSAGQMLDLDLQKFGDSTSAIDLNAVTSTTV